MTSDRFWNSPEGESFIGFAEIELYSNGKNEALGKPVATNLKALTLDRRSAALTDGSNFYGQILPEREWLHELAERHRLETERPFIVAELRSKYSRQKANLSFMIGLATLLAVGIIITLLVSRIYRMRQVTRVRERLAADLHDELGANLHTIGLLSDLAESSKNEPEELSDLLHKIRSETERSGKSVRRCTHMLEDRRQYTNIIEDMQRTARRIPGKLEHDFSVKGENYLQNLKPQTGYDLFFFYKECLVNISRHSEATEFKTRLNADSSSITLSVSDNGKGLSGSINKIPASLARRARLLKGAVSTDSNPDGGTSIHLHFRNRT